MNTLGKRIEFHCHSIFSDGMLLPNAIAREAEVRDVEAIAITDHVDASNLEFAIKHIVDFVKIMQKHLSIIIIPGVEISYLPPKLIPEYCKKSRKLGAKLVIVHGESPVEPVPPGTNHVAVMHKGLVDILAHPGNISEEDAKLAKENGIYLELSARPGHSQGNRHVAQMAKKTGALMLVNSDAHSDSDIITQQIAFNIAKDAGLSENEIMQVIKDNPQALLKKVS